MKEQSENLHFRWRPEVQETFKKISCSCENKSTTIYLSFLPSELLPSVEEFEAIWSLHPPTFTEIMIYGKKKPVPRWSQSYEHDYVYSGQVNNALPLPPALAPLLRWAQNNVDVRLNGLLVNWYDGSKGHYIGKHRDSTNGLVKGSPICIISLGEQRTLRMRPWKQKGAKDFSLENGSCAVIPWDTNLEWTHEIPHLKKNTGRRISVTMRAFE
jgi:alkylated DNA repair dioxygenase AlkB